MRGSLKSLPALFFMLTIAVPLRGVDMFRTPMALVRAASFALVLAFAPLSSISAQAPAVADVEQAAPAPGEFVWQPQRAVDGPVEVVVSIPLQMAYVYRGGTLIGVSSVSTGASGNDTPTGRFEILEKKRHHRSNLYDAPMPFMQRLTWDGIALHAGEIPGYPASHGCVRLPASFAGKLFAATRVGATVHIIDDVPPSPTTALSLARGEPLPQVPLVAAQPTGTR
jgi:hypothetical protein